MNFKNIYIFLRKNTYLIFLLIPTIVPFVLLSFFNHPAADDFCYADVSKDLGLFPSQIHWYTSWTGRFFSTFLLSVSPIVFDSIFLYKLTAAGLLLLFLLGIYLIVNALFEDKLSRAQKFTGSLFIIWIYLYQLPSILEGIYWLSGSFTYLTGITMSTFLMYFIIKAIKNKETKKRKNRNYIFAAILLFLIMGTNETIMVVWDIVLLILLIWTSIVNRKINKYILGFFIIALIASVIVYFAPGNEVRAMAGASTKSDVIWSLVESVRATYFGVKDWVTPSILIVLSMFIYPAYSLAKLQLVYIKSLYINPLVTAIIGLTAIVGAFFASFWSVGSYPPERSINISYFVFIVFSLLFILNGVIYLADKSIEVKPIPLYIYILFFVLLIISIPHSRNLLTPVRSILSGVAQRYDADQLERYEVIKSCQSNEVDICIVEERKNHAPGIAFHDIEKNEMDWKNLCVADFYNIKLIKVE